MPFMTYYSPEQYDAHPQNRAIVQDLRGIMYFGNNDGVLEFDGIQWRLISIGPKSPLVRSLDIDEKGRVYVGAQRELGYLKPDADGAMTYHSLIEEIPQKDRIFKDVWKTFCTKEGVYFVTHSAVFRWDGQQMKIWQLDVSLIPQYGFYVNDQLFLLQKGKGLVVLKNDTFELVEDGEYFANERIYAMLPTPNDDFIWIGTRKQGLFICKNNQCLPKKSQADAFLTENQLHHGCVLPNGNGYALATLRGGIALLDAEGNFREVINKSLGLANQQAYYVYPDRENGLWMALDNGIARIELESPLSYFPESKTIGNINDIVRHNERLYMATSQGLFYLQTDGINASTSLPISPKIQTVKGLFNECSALYSYEDALLIGTAGGIFALKNGNLSPIEQGTTIFCFFAPSPKSNVLYAGAEDGLIKLQLEEGKWAIQTNVAEITSEIHSITNTPDGALWLGTKYQNILRLHKGEVEELGVRNGLNTLNNNAVFYAGNMLLASTVEGVFTFDEKTNSFKIGSYLGKSFEGAKSHIGVLATDPMGNIWVHTKAENGIAMQQENGTFRWQQAPFNRIPKAEIRCIYPEQNGTIWIGGANGLVRIDADYDKDYTPYYSTIVRAVKANEQVLFKGVFYDDQAYPTLYQNPVTCPKISFKNNDVRFDFAAPAYNAPDRLQFSHLLEGYEKYWSLWNTEKFKEYTNLSPGAYRFQVKSKNVYGYESEIGSYAFVIATPWYQTWAAYLTYSLLFISAIALFTTWRTRRLRQQQKYLQGLVEERTGKLKQSMEDLETSNEELKATQNQLVVQQKLASLGQLTAGIAHEIQNPLNFITNFAKLSVDLVDELKEEVTDIAPDLNAESKGVFDEALGELEENVDKIVEHGNRIDSIVKNMLQHSRAESGDKTPCKINNLLNDYVQLAYHGFKAKNANFNVTIHKDLDKSMGTISVIQQDMGRALLNIINNALYAVHEQQKVTGDTYEPTIWVSSKKLKDSVEIIIKDNGTGIPAAIRAKIFNPFFTTKPTGKGTGLGLSLTFDIIVQQHGGQLEVTSKDGEFSCFRMVLPSG